MKNQNIVMLCQQNWNIGIATSAKNLAKEFAKNNRVLYVNMPLDMNTVLSGFSQPEVKRHLGVLKGETDAVVQAEANLWVLTPKVLGASINWLPVRSAFESLNRWNSKKLAASIAEAAKAVGFDSYYLLQDGIIFQGLELKKLLAPRLSIYYLRDYTIAVPYFQRHGPWVEAQLLQQADVVAVNSAYLGEYALKHNPNSFNIGQGCALEMYQADADYEEPADMARVPHPRIVYTGFLTTIRLDIDLLVDIVKKRPDWSLVLIGPEDDVFRRSELHDLPNVFFLGNKAPTQLSAYLQHADVCINPQMVNEATVGNYPLKIDEYLAMGKPVVATATGTMEMFADHVYLAHTPEDWLHMLDRAITEGGPSTAAEGIAFARSHTWEASAKALYATLEQFQPAHA
ncbi:glycosyltransferase [Hymenobacter arizonensis]|uniref:Glycosyl transferases group 1 n=1 Tax=Hymenobacter arizonensis TaxID=1227077 RepID=A0A1I5Z6C2_HYMAR|nr:glycosyltransferase [Hymenobacter arizonensis]SFQ52013.1 Glycosyl transferases group 1 [Hymenobacter arizonensis]